MDAHFGSYFNQSLFQDADLIFRVMLSAFLGALIGFERESHARKERYPMAGIRTYAAMSLGSCVFGLISVYAAAHTWMGADPTRIAAQVVSGVGFIGTGLIFRDGTQAKGLTTAASLWASAAIGLAVAYGMFVIAVGTTLIIFLLLMLSHFKWWQTLTGKSEEHHHTDEHGE